MIGAFENLFNNLMGIVKTKLFLIKNKF